MDVRAVNIVISGEAGQGLVTGGQLLAKSLVLSGFEILVSQSYMSRIRGGHNTLTIRCRVVPILAPREAIDLLASQSLPFAHPLLKLRAEHPGAETIEMDLALDQWHYYETRQALRGEAGESPLAYAMALDADLTNLLTVLRFTHDPREREALRDRSGSDEIGH